MQILRDDYNHPSVSASPVCLMIIIRVELHISSKGVFNVYLLLATFMTNDCQRLLTCLSHPHT